MYLCLGFYNVIHETSEAASQNAALMPFITLYKPSRENSKKSRNPRKRIATQYLLRKQDGSLVPVCAKSFYSVIMIGMCCSLLSVYVASFFSMNNIRFLSFCRPKTFEQFEYLLS